MRRSPTPSERVLWQALRRRQLGLRIHRQHLLWGYIADFYCPDAWLVIEVDGASHDGRATGDALRDRVLAEHGIATLRLSATMVERDLPAALGRIREMIAASDAAHAMGDPWPMPLVAANDS